MTSTNGAGREGGDRLRNTPIPAAGNDSCGAQRNGTGGKGISANFLLDNLPVNSRPKIIESPSLSTKVFIVQVTAGLGVCLTDLLRLEILTQQDINDLDDGMYGYEHIEPYRELIMQALLLRGCGPIRNKKRGQL